MRKTLDADIHRDVAAFHELFLSLGRRRSLRDPIAAVFEELQLTPPQIHTILWIGHDGPMTMGELSRRVGITEKTITGVVDRLEREEQVTRQRDPEDRRLVRVVLTRRGVALFKRLSRTMTEQMTFLMSRVDPADRRILLDTLRRILDQLASARATDLARNPK